MEGEDSFEAIVAKAVHEVHRNQLLCLSSLRSLLAHATLAQRWMRCASKITASQPHGRWGRFLWRVVGLVAGCPGPRGRDASSRGKPRPSKKLGRGTVVSRMDAVIPSRRYQYFLITSSAELVLPSGRTIQSPRHCASVGRSGFPSALATGAYCPFSLHSLSYRFQKKAP